MPTRVILATSALACALIALGVGVANAQPTPAPAASATPAASAAPSAAPSATPSPSPTPFKLITLNGFADAAFETVGGTNQVRFTNGIPSRIFDAATGPFFDSNSGRLLAGPNNFNTSPNLQNANLQATLNGSVYSAKLEGSFGTDADVIASNGQSRAGINLTQGYFQAVKGPVTFIAGKFETLAGAEVIENNSSSNFNITRSYLFGEAIPFTHTGVRATYAVNSKASVIVGANNGWDDWKFVGKPLTLEGGLSLTPSPGWALTAQTYNGNDFDGINPAFTGLPFSRPTGYTHRMLYDGVLTAHPTGALTVVANYDNGTQLANGLPFGDPSFFPTAHWNGVAGYAKYQLNPRYALALRKETFHDAEGFRTGRAQRLQSSTATVSFTPNSNWIFRAEYRIDTSDVPSFFDNNTPALFTGRQRQNSFALDSIVQFP